MKKEATFLSKHDFTSSTFAWPYNTWDVRSLEITNEFFDIGSQGVRFTPVSAGSRYRTDLSPSRRPDRITQDRYRLGKREERDRLPHVSQNRREGYSKEQIY